MLIVTVSRTLTRRVNPLTLRAEWERSLNRSAGVVYRVNMGEWITNEHGHTISIQLEFDAPKREHSNILGLVRYYATSPHWCDNPWRVAQPVAAPSGKTPHIRCESYGSRWHVLADQIQITPPEGVDRVTARYISSGVAKALQEMT